MYLKVDNNGEEQIYSFQNQNVVVIGRAPTSDIQVVTDGISRKHLEVRERDGEFFIIDFGSTNGTFLNEERLEPNVEHSFNSFFPIKLGFHVYLYLVDEISPEQLEAAITDGIEANEEKRRSELRAQRTQKLKASGTNSKIQIGDGTQSGKRKVKANKSTKSGSESSKRSRTKRKSRREQDSSDDEKLNMPLYIAVFLVILAGVAYSQGYLDRFINSDAPKVVKTTKKRPPKKVAPKVDKKDEKLTKEQVTTFMGMDKCFSDDEAALCKDLESFMNRDFNEGFVDVVDYTYMIVERNKFIKKLKDSIQLSEEDKKDILNLGRRYMGRNFNQMDIVNNNYRFRNDAENDKNLIFTSFIFYLLRSKALSILERVKAKHFTFIAFQQFNGRNQPVYAIDVPIKVLKNLSQDKELYKVSRIALYSGSFKAVDDHVRRNNSQDIKLIFDNIYRFNEAPNANANGANQ